MSRPARPLRKVPSETPSSLVGAGTVVTSAPSGAFEEGTFHGVYRGDVRALSRYDLTVDGLAPNVLSAARRDATSLDTAFATSYSEHGDARAVLLRHREVRGRVVDRYTLHRLVAGPPLEVAVVLAADRAHLMDVKVGDAVPPELPLLAIDDRRFVVGERVPANADDERDAGVAARVEVDGPVPTVVDGVLRWSVDPAPGEDWSLTLTITPRDRDGDDAGRVTATDAAELASPAPLVATGSDHRWQRAIAGAVADLASLRVEVGGERYTAAGAPWFMALFGRDALLTGFAALPLGTDDVLDTLEALARRQGRAHDPRTLEQPGRILHELRTGDVGVFGLRPGEAYYGTADATPLFVVLLAEALRWGADRGRVAGLLPAARAAVRWCLEDGDVDGDGFVEAVADPNGIENQGWKDSGDSMVHADGSMARPPIALVEVQAYVHGALLGLAELEAAVGDPTAAGPLRERAAELAGRFREAFWSERLGGLVMGLDAAKRPLAVASSNMGHALWTGILAPDDAERVAQRVIDPDLFGSWGIRTLGSQEVAYSPLAYHRGTIWPHDTALVAHGLARSGGRRAVAQVACEMLALAERFGYRLPELLGGTDRSELPAPVPYPVACSPQAWSAAAPVLLLRAVLGLEPDLPAGRVRLAPALPTGQTLTVRDLRLGDREVSIDVRADGTVEIAGADDLQVEVVPAG
jgi:glycogen debranching enzyme